MTSLITILIALLGYGTPSDFSNYSEEQLNNEIAAAQTDDGGLGGEWDVPGLTEEDEDGGLGGEWDVPSVD
jgi:hypothetical protein